MTETKDKFQGLPLGSRAVEVADGKTSDYFLTTFGRAPRHRCTAEAKTEPTLSQALHLLNGPTVQGKVSQGGVIKRLLEKKTPPAAVVEAIYLRCLSRKPTADETAKLVAIVNKSRQSPGRLEDVFWAVLKSREFLVQSLDAFACCPRCCSVEFVAVRFAVRRYGKDDAFHAVHPLASVAALILLATAPVASAADAKAAGQSCHRQAYRR